MSRLQRLERLERAIFGRNLPPVPDCIVMATEEPQIIEELSRSWPLTVARQWHRADGEDREQFAARVIAAAGPGALLAAMS